MRHGNKGITLVSVIEPKAEEEVIAAPVVVAPEKGKAKAKKTEKQNKK